MKATAAGLLLTALLFSSLPGLGQDYPDLIAESESIRVWGRKYYQNVSLTGTTILSYDPGPRKEHIIGITCNSFLLDASSSIIFGATSSHGTTAPLLFSTLGTPAVETRENGETEGNGAGTYGGQGFNAFGAAKSPYGSMTDFEIMAGSMGTKGQTVRYLYGGSWVVQEGRAGGRAGGPILIIGNDVKIEGVVNANGEDGWGELCESAYPGYSGSGGGILIAAKNLTIANTATITANGGEYPLKEHCYDSSRPYHYQNELVGKRDGGGGRIKIFYERGSISPEAVIEAEGWENGTIYIQQVPSIARLMNPGDVNEDGITNYEDLFLLQQSWQQELTLIPSPEDTPTPTATPGP